MATAASSPVRTDRTLALFGITGKTGAALATAAAARGWRVRGLARPASPAPAGVLEAQLVRGDLTDPARVSETVAGATAVCCVIGPRPPYSEVFCTAATAAIIAAMRRTAVRRLICQTGAMIGATANRSWLFERLARAFARRYPAGAQDRIEQERLVAASDLEWTIIKPPRLTEGGATGAVRAGPTLPVGLRSRISRADLAAFILDEIDAPRFVRERVFVRT